MCARKLALYLIIMPAYKLYKVCILWEIEYMPRKEKKYCVHCKNRRYINGDVPEKNINYRYIYIY